MKKMIYLTSWRPLLVRADLSRPRSRAIATDNQKTNPSQHATQQANEFAHLRNRHPIDAFLFRSEITPIGVTLTQERPYAFCVQPAKVTPYISFASCTADGGTQVPTR